VAGFCLLLGKDFFLFLLKLFWPGGSFGPKSRLQPCHVYKCGGILPTFGKRFFFISIKTLHQMRPADSLEARVSGLQRRGRPWTFLKNFFVFRCGGRPDLAA
jgi:hypothetical protein